MNYIHREIWWLSLGWRLAVENLVGALLNRDWDTRSTHSIRYICIYIYKVYMGFKNLGALI